VKTIKLTLTAMLAGLSFVLCVFVHFPQMAPFQHFVNVLAAVFVGPWYGSLAGIICGTMRIVLNGMDIQAVIGAMWGPVFGGLLYRKTKNIYLCGVLDGVIFFPIFNGGVILLSTLLAIRMLKEKLLLRQILGVLSGISGICLIGIL